MKLKLAFLLLFVIAGKPIYSQSLNTKKLDELFNSLEKRNQAMGSITISKNGKILYNRAIGYQSISNDIKILANSATNYRIWSITKTYTAVMILQLVEEGKLSLQTTLDNFYPNIPNSPIITIQNMLDHKSGVHDFVQNDTSEDWDTYIKEPLTHEFMVKNISQYNPDFKPGKQFQYSNSNYLLLGYIIEKLDNNLYEISLSNRISSKIGLTSTYFGVNALDTVENKAYSYQFDKQWKKFDEGDFSGLIPAGAGGIVSTTTDMSIFMEGLFTGKLISGSSLKEILNIKDSYGLGIMKIPFENTYSYGHTGGYIASESSLFYYPKDSLTIAYCTNGIVLRKEEILNHVLNIYHNKPFAVSLNRNYLGLLILSVGLLFFLGLKFKFNSFFNTQNFLLIGIVIFVLFWLSLCIAGFMNFEYSFIRNNVSILGSFYSTSGNLVSSTKMIIVLLSIPFLSSLFKFCKNNNLSVLPIIPMIFIPIHLAGTSLFLNTNVLYVIFANVVLFSAISPLLALILWKKKQWNTLRIIALFSLLLTLISIGFIISRPSIPEFVNNYFGLIQRLIYLSWTLWFAFLSLIFYKYQTLHTQTR